MNPFVCTGVPEVGQVWESNFKQGKLIQIVEVRTDCPSPYFHAVLYRVIAGEYKSDKVGIAPLRMFIKLAHFSH